MQYAKIRALPVSNDDLELRFDEEIDQNDGQSHSVLRSSACSRQRTRASIRRNGSADFGLFELQTLDL